ncbi:MAG: hydantoinase/oxoprolinase family protein [Hyphomicrobiales bacterium]|nr:hydantoinase/oxoprolinase family protein [Hyphomicrobiales bacterium]
MSLVAIDIGGTFTDLIAYDAAASRISHAKSLTTPHDLAQGVLDCIRKSGLTLPAIERLIHGSTIAINTLIERKGARTALLVTKGTRDVYAIGRGNRPDAYNLRFRRPRPLVARHATIEINERLLAGGEVREALDHGQVAEIAQRLRAEGYEAVAVCLLHSYANTEHERTVGHLLNKDGGGAYQSLSHEILRAYREYERMSTTVVNAYVGPKVSGYIAKLERDLRALQFAGELSIMQSNGGVMSPQVAARRPVMMMESGPVGGIIAGAMIAKGLGLDHVVSFDMGGTTAKASLVRNAMPTMAEGYYVGGYDSGDPVMIPVVDVVEVGTGGGSIAWIDEAGALKVGPHSAGADPGPICYRQGGDRPTITDANVVLGRIGAEDFLGGEMPLDAAAASAGIDARIGKPLGLATHDAARAIIDIAVAKMSLAVRQVSVQQGHDPREFALVASGGAGPLHAVAVARDLNIPLVVVPRYPSHFSALGMLLADERHDLVRTYLAPLDSTDFARVRAIVEELEREGRGLARSPHPSFEASFDLRYVGQEFTLSVPVTRRQIETGDRTGIRKAFDALHEQRYAHHAPQEPVEIINVRLIVGAPGARPSMPTPSGATAPPTFCMVGFGPGPLVRCPVHRRDALAAGAELRGPALIQEYGTTTVVPPGDALSVAATGELIIRLGHRP